jgi:hypothetical protein
LFCIAFQRRMGGRHVARAADPASSQGSEGLPTVYGQGELQRKAFGGSNGLAQGIGEETTQHNTDTADQHHEYTFTHDAHCAHYIHLDQHEADEDGQAIGAQEIISGVFKRDQAGIGQDHRRSVYPDQRRQEVEYFPITFLFQPEPETDHGDEHGHYAGG